MKIRLPIFFLLFLSMGLLSFHFVKKAKVKEPQNADFSSYIQKVPGTDIRIKMMPVPGGTFKMGSPKNEPGRSADEGPQREVAVDSFWMAAFETTWDQFDVYFNDEVSGLNDKKVVVNGKEVEIDGVTSPTPEYIDMSFGMGRQGGYPVVNITNYAAIMFAKWLFAKTGVFYRLPTEAEWEYACRAGSNTAYYYGNDSSQLEEYAWYKANSPSGYQKVGQKKPNAFGLYDMHGNVAEWTIDQYKKDYFDLLKGNPAKNPWFKPAKLYPRSFRGGSWMDDAGDLRSAKRSGSSKKLKRLDPQLPKSLWWLTNAPYIGFRLVRPKKTPPIEKIKEYWIEAMQDY